MRHIIYIMGVSGSGKTTIGKLLSQKTGIPFFDGDDFHSMANKEKMKNGQPLTDDDRKEWLAQLNRLAIEQIELKGAIIACSALKEKYRSLLAEGVSKIRWIFLQGSYEEIHKRLEKRTGHYMPVQLLRSQFESLEVPVNALSLNIRSSPETIVEIISQHLNTQR